ALMAIIRANVRVPEMVLGDFHAQIAGGAVGGERLREFMHEFGLERLEPLADEIIGRTERAMRAAIKALTPGAYEYAITSDGFDEPLTIRARCEVRDDELWIDYRGSSPASRRGVNVVMNYTEAYTTYGVKVIVSPAPLVVERKCLRPDSGGTGKYRGGLGQTIAFRARTLGPYACSVLCDRTAHSAAGFLGGGPGARGMVRIDGVAPANPKAE